MNNIRLIRNIFAHTKTDISFQASEIAELCHHIGLIDRVNWEGQLGEKPKTPLEKFTKAATFLLFYLELSPLDTPNKPLRYTSKSVTEAIFS